MEQEGKNAKSQNNFYCQKGQFQVGIDSRLLQYQLFMSKYRTLAPQGVVNELAQATQEITEFRGKKQFKVFGKKRQQQVSVNQSLAPQDKHRRLIRMVLIFSRVHDKYKLKFATLFKAISIYQAYLKEDDRVLANIPQLHMGIAALFLSMKYEEIYPPSLKQLFVFFGKSFTINKLEYCKCQKMLLQLLDGDLNLPTAKTVIDELLKSKEMEVHYYSYYLLELSFTDYGTLSKYTDSQIYQAVVFSLVSKRLFQALKTEEKGKNSGNRVVDCCCSIFAAKINAINNNSALFKKYSELCYYSVSEKTIFLPRE